MMLQEFTDRTGVEPTLEEYAEIERAYAEANTDKDTFCMEFMKTGGDRKLYAARARKIRGLQELLDLSEKTIQAKDRRIEKLQAQIDRELDWKPCDDTGTNMCQDDYEHLLEDRTRMDGVPEYMSEDEAKLFIAEECGFDLDKIEIVTEVSAYEVNKYHQIRESARCSRHPLYAASDWNYFRFNVCGFMWEIVNGSLFSYNC